MANNKRSRRFSHLLGGAATALFAINTASAQTPAADPAATAAPETADEIVVTATKSNERLLSVPASVSVVRADTLSEQGAVRFQDYATRVPGLSLTTARQGNAQVTLRGITTGAAQAGSTTAYYIDEAPVGSVNAYNGGAAITPDLDPSDLSQIEVLKGPQGTLYGAGAVGGLLKFTTAAPNLGEFEGHVSAGLTSVPNGETGHALRGMVNVPIVNDRLALHVSGFTRRDPGYIDNINPLVQESNANGADVQGGRAVLAFAITPNVQINLSAIGQDTSSDASNTIDVDAATLEPITNDHQQNRFVQERNDVHFRLYNATLNGDFGGLNLVSSTTFQTINYAEQADGTRSYGAFVGGALSVANLGVRVNTNKHTERWSEELRATRNGLFDGLLDLQAGAYWTHEDDDNRIPGFDTFSTVDGSAIPLPPLAIASIVTTYDEYSVFGNARLHIGPKFDVLGGVRVAHDEQDYIQDYAGLVVGPRRVNTGEESGDTTTWMISPRYQFSDDAMVYGRIATGYRPGGPNAVPPPSVIVEPLTFDPDRLTQYEVGFKGQALEHTLTLQAALFYTNWNDVQIQTSAAGFNFLVNGGKAISQGGELSLTYQPIHALTLGANIGYTDAKLGSPAPAAGGLDGDRLPYVPHLSGSLTGDYVIALNDTTDLNFGATVNYIGDRVTDYSNRFPKHLDAYTTLDLRAGLSYDKWTLSAFARNVTDERAIIVAGPEGLAASTTPGAFYSAALIAPRTVGAELSLRF